LPGIPKFNVRRRPIAGTCIDLDFSFSSVYRTAFPFPYLFLSPLLRLRGMVLLPLASLHLCLGTSISWFGLRSGSSLLSCFLRFLPSMLCQFCGQPIGPPSLEPAGETADREGGVPPFPTQRSFPTRPVCRGLSSIHFIKSGVTYLSVNCTVLCLFPVAVIPMLDASQMVSTLILIQLTPP